MSGYPSSPMRETTTEWESEFFFALWDNTVMRVLEKEPKNIGYLAYVIRSELDVLCRTWRDRDQPSTSPSK